MVESKTWSETINTIIDNRLLDVHTSIPAIVQSFDASNGRVDVQPALRRKLSTGDYIDIPIISGVPVMYPQSQDSIVSFPLKKDDEVLLVFSERSVDSWKNTGGVVDPLERRKFDLSDAFAIPIGRSQPVDSSKLQIKHKDAIISLDGGSKVAIENNSQELLDLIDQTLTGLENAKVNTMLGPQPLLNAATFTAIKTALGELKQ